MERRKPYLLTGGLVPLLQNRHHLVLSQNTKDVLRSLEHSYFTEARYWLQGREDEDKNGPFLWDVQFIPDQEIDASLRSLLKRRRAKRPLVSFDDVYCTDLADAIYNVTRIQNPDDINADPTSGPRLRSLSLEKQVRAIAKIKNGREIDIMDIGTFGGNTLVEEIKHRFEPAGIKVKKVYLAFAGKEGIEKLESEGIEPVYAADFDWIDWLEMRDCIGFDGRKVPLTDSTPDDVANAFLRYIENSGKWASIPEQIKVQYERLYHAYFHLAKSCLEGEGYEVSLTPSKQNHNVHELVIKARSIPSRNT